MVCGNTVRPVCRSCLQLGHRLRVSHPTRLFSLTASRQRQGLPPTFEPTVSDELSKLLDTIRSNVFLPAHLIKAQQDLVFKTKNHELLSSEPFYVEIGPKNDGERVQLRPIRRIGDIPNSWKATTQALRLMAQEPQEKPVANEDMRSEPEPGSRWVNLKPLLQGMRKAGRKWRPWQWEYMIRVLGENDGGQALLASAMSRKIGLFFVNVRTVREVFWACRNTAVRGGWSLNATSHALELAKRFTRLLSDNRERVELERSIRQGEIKSREKPAAEPDVIGVVLELAARKAELLTAQGASFEAQEEAKATVATLVSRLAPNMHKVQTETSGTRASAPPAATADYELLRWIPVARGLKAAQNVLGSSAMSSEQLVEGRDELERIITASQQTVRKGAKEGDKGNRPGLAWSQKS